MIGWRDEAGALHHDTLFGAFAALARREAWSFPALRPHQREPWHAFTVQVAAMALIRAGVDTLPGDEAAWRELLVALSDGVPEAWELVVDDWSKPALLQPPVVATANRADYKNIELTPDALDMLVTSRNHEIKQERLVQGSDEDWLFSLVTLQTMEGQMGRGNYGISRMNSGYGSRMTLGVRHIRGGAAGAFCRDVGVLVDNGLNRVDRRSGLGLVWMDAWDGTALFDYTKLDELYVEVCRRVRLVKQGNQIEARLASSTCERIAADQLGGNTGDPWMPLIVDTKKGRATEGKLISFPPTGEGFGYRQMARLLDGSRTTPPPLARLFPEDKREGLAIVAAALVRGQGKTEGLHRRTVWTSRVEEIEATGDVEVLDRIGDVAKARSDEAGEAGTRLRRALISLVQGGPEKARLDDDAAGKKVDPWVRRFDARADRVFFDDAFWSEAANTAVNPRREWRERLRLLADNVFDEAAEAAPRTEMRRIRAIARAKSYLEGQMAKWIGEVA